MRNVFRTYPVDGTNKQNYPNPFNLFTEIRYEFPLQLGKSRYNVHLKVFTLLGKEVETLVNDDQEKGFHSVEFDASGISSGVIITDYNRGIFLTRKNWC
ncbi:MAG: hypothetical protein HYZ34_10190 [Ignavibacteriae bacterium]|nr:hypothetical protein [Ignavibacteriota bacterium]